LRKRLEWGRTGEHNQLFLASFLTLRRSENGPPPPGVVVAAKRMVEDPTNEPQYGERVPYVIARGLRGSRLVDRAMDPLEMLQDG